MFFNGEAEGLFCFNVLVKQDCSVISSPLSYLPCYISLSSSYLQFEPLCDTRPMLMPRSYQCYEVAVKSNFLKGVRIFKVFVSKTSS